MKASPSLFRVQKMKFAKTRDPETNKSINDKTAVHYNARITICYVERQCTKEDPDSVITNDANLWATETMHNSKYPLELFL